jgi:hypothetical protein
MRCGMRDWTEVNLYIKKRILGEKRDDKKEEVG